ncbi:MAG: MFS transporter [Parcubacteria group bacterium]|nr:MFS transporter [Parcubacteria group bacterium]
MNKNVFLWGLYDFANTPLTAAIGGLYLAQWIVLDNRLDDIWYGGVFTLATIFLLFTSPFLGAWSDQLGKRKPFLTWMTFILLIAGGLLGIFATSSLPSITRVIIVLFLFFIVQYVYQVSLIFYNSLLKQLSTSKTIGKISGIGQFFGELGWLLGPAILLPFATGKITLWGEPGRAQVFIPSVLILVILGLPMIFWFRERKVKLKEKNIDFKVVYSRTIQGLVVLFKENKNAALFLVAFMFVSDALLTAQLYFAIYMDQIFKVGDTQKFLALASLEVVAILSSLIVGKLSDNYGTKRLLILSCWILFFGFFVLSVNSSLPVIYILASLLGLGFAGFYVTSRALLLKISPVAQHGEYFGFYSTFQKFASIIGPLTWGATTLLLKDYGVVRYRVAVLALAFLMLVGTLLMNRVHEEK